jgi:hypothetical protein
MASCGSVYDSGWQEEHEESAAELFPLVLAKERKVRQRVHDVKKKKEDCR